MATPEPVRCVLGFDFGTHKIGVASGQSVTGTASPLAALKARQGQPDWAVVKTLLGEWQPDALIVGLPLNMDDSESDSSQRARKFARQLHGRFGKPVHFVDERLTTRQARELANSYGPGDTRVDSLAAMLLVESFFASRDTTGTQ